MMRLCVACGRETEHEMVELVAAPRPDGSKTRVFVWRCPNQDQHTKRMIATECRA